MTPDRAARRRPLPASISDPGQTRSLVLARRLWLARSLHQPRCVRRIHLRDVKRNRVTDRSRVAWRRPQEAHTDVVERPDALDGLAAHDLEVITVFPGPELQPNRGDRSDVQLPAN